MSLGYTAKQKPLPLNTKLASQGIRIDEIGSYMD